MAILQPEPRDKGQGLDATVAYMGQPGVLGGEAVLQRLHIAIDTSLEAGTHGCHILERLLMRGIRHHLLLACAPSLIRRLCRRRDREQSQERSGCSR